MKLITGYQNTKNHNEDLALTPYLFLVYNRNLKVYGIGLCWIYFAVFIGLGFNLMSFKSMFINLTRKKNEKT